MTPAGIEPPTFRFVAQHLNHCATAVPIRNYRLLLNKNSYKMFVRQRTENRYVEEMRTAEGAFKWL